MLSGVKVSKVKTRGLGLKFRVSTACEVQDLILGVLDFV